MITSEQFRALQRPVVLPIPREMLDYQMETLVGKGLANYDQANAFRKNLPSGLFLFVPPRPKEMDLKHLVSLIEVNGKKGVNYLDERYLKDEAEIPAAPYLMIDVEDGDIRRNIKPSVNLKNILTEKRSPFLAYEGIVLCVVFPEILKHHYPDLVGSRYGSEVRPYLCLSDGGPGLIADWNDVAVPEWGAPSCGRRIGAGG